MHFARTRVPVGISYSSPHLRERSRGTASKENLREATFAKGDGEDNVRQRTLAKGDGESKVREGMFAWGDFQGHRRNAILYASIDPAMLVNV